MVVINGVATGLYYIASQGNIAVTIVCTAIHWNNAGNLVLQGLAARFQQQGAHFDGHRFHKKEDNRTSLPLLSWQKNMYIVKLE